MRKALTRVLFGMTLVTLATALCACQPVPAPPAPSQATLTATAAVTTSPQPTSTPYWAQTVVIPGSSTGMAKPGSSKTPEIIEATLTLPVPPTPIPNIWKSFSDAGLNVSLRYPESWRMESSARASGSDGFFEFSTRTYQPSEFDRLDTLCVLDANDPDQTSKSGPTPLISDWQGWDPQRQTWFGSGCIVSPSGVPGSQSVLFVRDTRPEARNQILVMRADAAHFGGILSSLRFIKFDIPPASTGAYDSPACQQTPVAAPVATRQVADLVISEYAIANVSCDPWKHFDGFQTRLMGLSIDRSAIQERAAKTRLENANRVLARFGYQLVAHPASIPVYDLLKGSDAILTGFTNFSAVSVNAAGNDFILWVQDNLSATPPSEVRSGGVRTLTVWGDGFNSVWVGANLISFDYPTDQLFPVGAPALVAISRNGRKIETLSIPQMGSAGSPVRGVWSWSNHWVLELAGVLVQDGELQNLKLGYAEIFDWHLVNDKPFFMMRQVASARASQPYGLVYDGQVLPVQFDDIIHGDLCCDSARYSIQNSPNGSLFYALKDGIWFLVSIQTAQ